MEDDIECGGFVFIHNFDSGNIGHVDEVPKEIKVANKTASNETIDFEFNVWTRPDCLGTEFENGNRTWFYFGVQSAPPAATVKLNIVNINRQGKMYSQGMAPVTKTIPGKPQWERIKDKPTYTESRNMSQERNVQSLDGVFTLSFKFRAPENKDATIYFAFTYPYTYADLRNTLGIIDNRYMLANTGSEDDIYYCRECVCHSLEKRQVDLLTISSMHGITDRREERLTKLFPENKDRPFKFHDKKVIFISARVHPGETPSSFVFNGFLTLLMNRTDPIAVALRKMYVFKLIPFLNPDGVANGHYRTDTRGVNLNRVYLTPSFELHPTVYAARALIRYYHFGHEEEDDVFVDGLMPPSCEEDDCISHKSAEYPDQENDKSYQLNKRKKNNTSNNFWNISGRFPLTNTVSGSNTASGLNRKIRVDSIDDTSSSLPSGSTLASKVEDLNLNGLHRDAPRSGFNSPITHDECATNNVIKQPCSKDGNSSDGQVTDEDDVVVRSLLRDTLKDSITLMIKNRQDLPSSSEASKMSGSKSFSTTCSSQPWCEVCKKTVMDLETKMPGLSKILPAIYKNQNASKKIALNCKICINCRAPVLAEAHHPKDKNYEDAKNNNKIVTKAKPDNVRMIDTKDSNLFLYIDLHGHASKKGIFMYGNHFDELDSCVDCMLLPRIMSLNNLHFHFASCNFTKRNMYARDRRDGMSREGSGRVAVLKATGLTRSYTLECNYNTGRVVNVLPPRAKEAATPSSTLSLTTPPPKYTPHLFEEVGKSLGASILDLTGHHPNSRIPGSEHHNLSGIKDWLKLQVRHTRPSQVQLITSPRPSITSRIRTPISRPPVIRSSSKQSSFVDPERKENLSALGFQADPHSTRQTKAPGTHSSLTALKSIPVRSSRNSEQSLAAKAQRNLSLITIKKPAVTKHSAVFKSPSQSRSPGPKIRIGSKTKIPDDADSVKGGIRSLMESNRSNTKQHSFKSRIVKSDLRVNKEHLMQKQGSESSTSIGRKTKVRSGQTSYQKQPGQAVSKPLNKRLKISQFIKYSDNSKEKYRMRKGPCPKGSEAEIASSSEDLSGSWTGVGVAGGSGLVPGPGMGLGARRPPRPPRRPSLRHLAASATDLTNIRRHKF